MPSIDDFTIRPSGRGTLPLGLGLPEKFIRDTVKDKVLSRDWGDVKEVELPVSSKGKLIRRIGVDLALKEIWVFPPIPYGEVA